MAPEVIAATPEPTSRAPRHAVSAQALSWALGGFIALVALALRLWHIGLANLWLDEVASWALARSPAATILANVQQSPHGPAYYFALKAWMAVFGDSEAGLRSLSAVSGAAVVFLVYRLGLRLGRRRADRGQVIAVLASVLVLLSPVQVYFSQEARFHMFAAALALVAVAGYLAWRARWRAALKRSEEGAIDVATFGAFRYALLMVLVPLVLAIYAYPLSILLLPALWIDVSALAMRSGPVAERRRLVREWVVLQVLAGLACLPLAYGRQTGAAMATQVWRTTLGAKRAAGDFLFYWVQQVRGGYSWPGGWHEAFEAARHIPAWGSNRSAFLIAVITLPGAALAVALCLATALPRSWRTPWRVVWLAAVTALAAEAAISSRESLELSRYALFVAPLALLLVARGAFRLPRMIGVPAVAVLLCAAALGTREVLHTSVRDTDYRTVAAFLGHTAHAGDTVVVSPWYAAPAASYYLPTLRFIEGSEYRGGWAKAAVPGEKSARTPSAWWLVTDYRGGDFFHAPVDSLPGTAPFRGTALRVTADTVLPTSIRVVRLERVGGASAP